MGAVADGARLHQDLWFPVEAVGMGNSADSTVEAMDSGQPVC